MLDITFLFDMEIIYWKQWSYANLQILLNNFSISYPIQLMDVKNKKQYIRFGL